MARVSLKNVSIIELLVAINRRYSDIPAVQMKEGDGFRTISYIELGRRTSDTSYNLKKLGIEKGDRIAILSESRPEWSVAFFGIISCAGIVVPMDIKLSDTEIQFILGDSEAKCIFASDKFIERVKTLNIKLPNLKNIISLDDTASNDVLLLRDFKVPENEIAHRDIYPEDTAIIVYTSGTTGIAKGVELTYKNMLFEVKELNEYVKFNAQDHFLSILPLNHMLEITSGLIAPLYAGACITYCDSLKPTNIIKLMQETKTTAMICVPLILKMFHGSILKKIEGLPQKQKRFFYFLMKASKFLLKFRIRAGKLFFKKIHKQFGGALRCFVSGGAPLDPSVEEDFTIWGFNVLQGYGLTETSPVLTANTFTQRKYGSVGVPLKGVEIKILPQAEGNSKEGEIVVRGPNIMRGYYRNKEKTDEVIRDGWFHTGDIGYVDKDGFLYITGRIKNMIVLGGGKKVHPEEVEEVMSKSNYIKEICVLGKKASVGLKAGTEEAFAVIVPNLDYLDSDKKQDRDFIKEKISSEINRLSENLAEYKKISDFMLYFDELPKTSTRKIKRKEVLEKIVIPVKG